MKVWLGNGDGGELVDADRARVSVFDHGYTVAEGVFETMKLVDGKVFLWQWHLERLRHSATVIGLHLPEDELLTRAVVEIAHDARAELDGVGRLRLTVSCSNGEFVSDSAGATVVCTALPAKRPDATARLRTAAWPRNESNPLVTAKSTSYLEQIVALQRAQAVNASDALFFNTQGLLSECTTSNVFVVRDGTVQTPRTSDGLLAGVTRRFVLTLGDADIPISEAGIVRSDLDAADEVFITSSLRDIQPVVRIDDRDYSVGPVTVELQRRFAQRASADWCWV